MPAESTEDPGDLIGTNIVRESMGSRKKGGNGSDRDEDEGRGGGGEEITTKSVEIGET